MTKKPCGALRFDSQNDVDEDLDLSAQESLLNGVLREHYNPTPRCPPSDRGCFAAIRSRGPNCNMLVFGLGNDSPLMANLNHDGYTLFLENIPDWIDKVRSKHPDLNIDHMDYPTTRRRFPEGPGSHRASSRCAGHISSLAVGMSSLLTRPWDGDRTIQAEQCQSSGLHLLLTTTRMFLSTTTSAPSRSAMRISFLPKERKTEAWSFPARNRTIELQARCFGSSAFHRASATSAETKISRPMSRSLPCVRPKEA